jgi:hypothetical protein
MIFFTRCSNLNEKGVREAELIQALDKNLEKFTGTFTALEDSASLQGIDENEKNRLELAAT